VALVGAGAAVGWVLLSIGLGKAQEKRAREAAKQQ
jgi:hypothetical protein